MTIKFSSDRLADLGYRGLTTDQYNELNAELYAATEELVGLKLASEMKSAQLDEFERFFEIGDEEGAFRWIETEFPHYAEVVTNVVAELEVALAQAVRETRAPYGGEELTSVESVQEDEGRAR